MIYIENTMVKTAKSEIYLGNMGLSGRTPGFGLHSPSGLDAYTGPIVLPDGPFSDTNHNQTSNVSGDSFGVFIWDVIVPAGYISGDFFSGSFIYERQTLSNLSMSEYLGSFLWTLPNDTITLAVSANRVGSGA